jgi:hypothetical protein
MTSRKSPYSQVYKLTTVAEGITVLLPVVEDLEDHYLKGHLDRAVANGDYEYAMAVTNELNRRGLKWEVNFD